MPYENEPDPINLKHNEQCQTNTETYKPNTAYEFKLGKLILLWMWRDKEHGLVIINKDGEELYSVTWESVLTGGRGLWCFLKHNSLSLIALVADALKWSLDRARKRFERLLNMFDKDGLITQGEAIQDVIYLPAPTTK